MRITSQMTRTTYLRNLERNYENQYNSEKKIASYRQWGEASENPAQAAHAMRVRKAIANLNTYQANLQTADNIYASAESSVMAISELIQATYEKCVEAANGTNDIAHTHTPDQMEMLAQTVETYADEISRLMNLEVADRRIFGGVNNDEVCFNIENLGEGKDVRKIVKYNGVEVDNYDDPTMFPQSKTSFVDIGLGMHMAKDGRIDEQSAMELTFNGCDVIGCGKKPTTAYIEVGNQYIENGANYNFELSLGQKKINVNFTGGATAEANVNAINAAIDGAFKASPKDFPGYQDGQIKVMKHGLIVNAYNNETVKIRDNPDELEQKIVDNSAIKLVQPSIQEGKSYTLNFAIGSKTLNVSFVGQDTNANNVDEINRAINVALINSPDFGTSEVDKIKVNSDGTITNNYSGDVVQISDPTGVPDQKIHDGSAIKFEKPNIQEGKSYTVNLDIGGKTLNVSFVGKDTNANNVDEINRAIDEALTNSSDFGTAAVGKIQVNSDGTITNTYNSDAVQISDAPKKCKNLTVENQGKAYSNNIIQSILDAADYIRKCDGEEIARYADHIYSLQTKVSLSLADIGNTTKFIEFNQTRITNNLESMTELQNQLESTNIPAESTQRDMLKSIYSATLQLSASALPLSIFNFMS